MYLRFRKVATDNHFQKDILPVSLLVLCMGKAMKAKAPLTDKSKLITSENMMIINNRQFIEVSQQNGR